MSKKEKPLFLDIGTETVKLWKDETPTIVYYDRHGIKEAITEAAAGVKPKEILVGLPPDIHQSRVVFQKFQRENPRKIISKEEERKICQTILGEIKLAISQEFAGTSGILPQELEFLDSEVLETKIDGYGVPKLASYQGKTLEFRVFSSFSPRWHLENFQGIFQELDFQKVKIIYPFLDLIRKFKGGSLAFLDVGGEVTQIFLIKNGELEKTCQFLMGGKDFSQALSEKFGLDEIRARILKEGYSRGEMAEPTRQRIKEVLINVAQEWLVDLQSKFENLGESFPRAVFLAGGGSRLPEIREVLEEKELKVKP